MTATVEPSARPHVATDTRAATAGALCGALGGVAAVPYVDKLEDGERGRTHIRELAAKLVGRVKLFS